MGAAYNEGMNTLTLLLVSHLLAATPVPKGTPSTTAKTPPPIHCRHDPTQTGLPDPHLPEPIYKQQSEIPGDDEEHGMTPHPSWELPPALPVRWSEGWMQVPWMAAPVSCLQRVLAKLPMDCRHPSWQYAYTEEGWGAVGCGVSGGFSWQIVFGPASEAMQGDCVSEGVVVRLMLEPTIDPPKPRR